ncbi:hypothetical protein LTR64_007092 [Lithohypha guttulata]|uniref:uncharacterized protein n=1 Tax=Lithohypha guttulata TaxID=1690604 RepID=UPI00315DC48B
MDSSLSMTSTTLSTTLALLNILVLFASAHAVMNYDPNISNGTCYYAKNKQADPVYAPAGNVVFGHTYCCQLGDKLNTGTSVCVTQKTPYYTYIAGCTDPDYSDQSCPYKGNYTDHQWVGMAFCEGKDVWVGCPNGGSSKVGPSPESENCTCDLEGDDPDVILVSAAQQMTAGGLLPASTGGDITWYGGQFPSHTVMPTTQVVDDISSVGSSLTSLIDPTALPSDSTPSDNTTSFAGKTSSTSSTQQKSTSSLSPLTTPTTASAAADDTVSHDSNKLGTGAIAGIAAGIVSALFPIVVCLYLIFRDRQRRRKQHADPDAQQSPQKPPIDAEPTLPDVGSPWLDDKPELPCSSEQDGYSKSNIPIGTAITTPSQSIPPSPLHTAQVYKPFTYQPSTMDEIQELPDHERPQWAQTNWGTYGPYRNTSPEQASKGNGPKGSVHELPG